MAAHLHPDAYEELRRERKRIMGLFVARIITREQARRQHFEACRRIYSQAVTDDGRSCFPIKCSGCGEITVIAEDVKTYRCHCSPHEDRWVSKSWRVDLPIGTNQIRDFMSPASDSHKA
jgi:hypothetical protein